MSSNFPSHKLEQHNNGLHFAVMPDGRKFLVEDPTTFGQRVRKSREAMEKGLIKLFPIDMKVVPPDSCSLASYQTPFKNQLDRGTCWAFAIAAALEAAYKRKYGITIDLSEQYIFSMTKCMELWDDYVTNPAPYENNSSFGGFQGSSDCVTHLSRCAVPEERYAPYKSQWQLDQIRENMPEAGTLDDKSTQEQLDAFEYSYNHIPLAARLNAKYLVKSCSPIPDTSVETLERVLSGGHEIIVDFSWGHCVLFIGYDRKKQIFYYKDSGGNTDFSEYSYDLARKDVIGGWYINDIGDPNADPQLSAMWIGKWKMDHDGWKGDLTIRRCTNFRRLENEPTKLGNYYRDGKRYDVNGYFSDNGRSMIYYIAETTDKVQPGTLTGQRFETYLFSRDHGKSAGSTEWQQTTYGVALMRVPIPGNPSNGFQGHKWKGSWSMNHDGWRGTLNIDSIKPRSRGAMVSGTYLTSDKKKSNMSGFIFSGYPHILHCIISFSSDNKQNFRLMYHTMEDDVFSGVTDWSGKTFGVQGFKTGQIEQDKWRWCKKCQGLYYSGHSQGACSAGGNHEMKDSGDYSLVHYTPDAGQNMWRWCNRCQGLFYAGGASMGVCPARNDHAMLGSGDYSLAMDKPGTGQNKWRWCKKCQGLYYSGFSQGSCPAGGNHDIKDSGDYRLAMNQPSAGQNMWRWCKKCQGLYYSGISQGACPAGGNHDIKDSGDYSLAIDQPGAGQNKWRWCDRCQGLYYSGFSQGVCPALPEHDMTGSGDYSLAMNQPGTGQNKWRRCKKCQGLYYSGLSQGVCPAGGKHAMVDSGDYSLKIK